MNRRISHPTGLALLAAVATTTVVAAFPPAPPDDPEYANAGPCPGNPLCSTPTGQWNLLSFSPNFPPTLHASGMSVDLAWDVTTGRSDVTVVVLDTGVNYDHEDLRNQIWLNRGELPVPDGGACAAPVGDPHDCNGDGTFNVVDYTGDSRITDVILPGVLSRSDLRVFEDGVDDDGNGFVDDLSGWDARDRDNDEYRSNGDGHGTGRNGIIAAETDNGAGIAGVCPECRLANVRVDGSFVTRSEGPAIGALWSADHGHEVINMALGATNASSLSRSAFDYATRKNVLAINASANEFSFHHNFQTVFDDVMAIGGVVFDNPAAVSTYLRKANFSNYGAHLDVVTPTDSLTTSGGGGYGTSSGTSTAVPHAAGVAGLVFSRARELIDLGVLDTTGLALADISALEVRQIIDRTADDVTQVDDPSGPYPYLTGWDRYTGYGRVNARAAVDRVAPGTMPPEADINSPEWYSRVSGVVDVGFYANARWATDYDWVLEVGAGVEPASFTTIASGSGEPSTPALSSASFTDNFTRAWDTSSLADGFYVLRLRVADDLGNTSEDRMGVWVATPDPDLHVGWPVSVGASVESVAGGALVDLDDDGTLEIVLATADGDIHALRHDGTSAPGFPVRTAAVTGLPLCCSDAFDGDPADGEVTVTGGSLVGGVTVADIDLDGADEICAGSYDGQLYCWNSDGTPQPGFPVATDIGSTIDPYSGAATANAHPEALLTPPAMADLDGDGTLELIAGAFDQQLYVWHADGTRMAPWPLPIFDSAQVGGVNAVRPAEIISLPLVADIDDDGTLEIVFGTNEDYATPNVGGQGGSGRVYAYEPDGTLEPGWPVAPESLSPSAVPLVADGAGTSPVAADIDDDGTLEIAIGVLLSDPIVYNHDGSEFGRMSGVLGGTGAGGDGDEVTPEGGLGKPTDAPVHYYVSLGAFADVDGDAATDYLVGTVGNAIASLALASGAPAPFDHYLSAWDATTGTHKANFPRVMEDWQFFTGPAVADIDGDVDALPEIIAASGGYFVHAFKTGAAAGTEPPGWPKNVGQWVVMTPSIGDLDDDGTLEVVVATRMGEVHVWNTAGATCGDVPWRKAGHDERASGVAGNDVLAPARIDDLVLSHSGGATTLDWTAVGDDRRCGAADTYELFTAAFPIFESNTDAAATAPAPAPSPAGSAESTVVTGSPFVALRAVDEAGNRARLAGAGPLEIRRLRVRVKGAARDKLSLTASTVTTLTALGMPGHDVVVRLVDAAGVVFEATVPGDRFESNAKGNKLKFRDRTGLVAGGIQAVKIATKSSKAVSRVRVRVRDVDLSAAGTGTFVQVVEVGPTALVGSGTLRTKGSGLTFP